MSKVHEFRMEPRMWGLVKSGVKTAECRIGDKAQRVRPGDTLLLKVGMADGEAKVLERRVEMMMLYPSLSAARAWWPGQAGFNTWEEFEAAMREFYGHRVCREPFTVMYLEEMEGGEVA